MGNDEYNLRSPLISFNYEEKYLQMFSQIDYR